MANLSSAIMEKQDKKIERQKKKRRVVITGLGIICPNGIGKEEFWKNLLSGPSGIRKVTRFNSEAQNSQIAGEIQEFDPLKYLQPKEVRHTDRSNRYAIAAALMAMEDAHLDIEKENRQRIGSVIGNAVCGLEFANKELEVMQNFGPRKGSPFLSVAFFPCGNGGLLSIRLGIKGEILTVSNGNTSGTDAIGMAYRIIQEGKNDVMFTGGTEAPLVPALLCSLNKLGVLSKKTDDLKKASRPFNQNTEGFVLSEGAGILVLEELQHARKRKANIYCEIVGYQSTNSAYDVFHVDISGKEMKRAIREILNEANIEPEDIDFVNAYGFSIKEYDIMEINSIESIFKERNTTFLISSISPITGNTLGAQGGLQGVTSAMAIKNKTIPPLSNCEFPYSGCNPEHLARIPSKKQINFALQTSLCFMGKNSCLLMKNYWG